MSARRVTVQLNGLTPLLMHADNIDWADEMERWKNDPKNKALSKAGDDRTPVWRWMGCLNYDDPQNGVITIPSEYIMRAVMGGAADVPTGRGKKTFKAQSQSGMMCSEFHWPLLVNGKPIRMADIQALRSFPTFREQAEGAGDAEAVPTRATLARTAIRAARMTDLPFSGGGVRPTSS